MAPGLATMLAACGATTAAEIQPVSTGAPDRLVFEDAYQSGRLDPSIWNTCHWWDQQRCTIRSNDELQWYVPEQVSVVGGRLRLTADHPADVGSTQDDSGMEGRAGDLPYVSGMVTTGPTEYRGESKFAFKYGRVEVDINVPSGRGLWAAVWMLPATSESRPEIDLVAVLGQQPETWIFHLHPEDRNEPSLRSEVTCPTLSSGTHTIGLLWEPRRVEWFVDGKRVWSVEGDDVPAEDMHLVINLAVGGVYSVPPDAVAPFPSHMYIDAVRVWQ